MLTWGPILGSEKVAQVAAYIVEKNREATGRGSSESDKKKDESDHS